MSTRPASATFQIARKAFTKNSSATITATKARIVLAGSKALVSRNLSPLNPLYELVVLTARP